MRRIWIPPERGHSCPQQASNARRFRSLQEPHHIWTLLRTGMSALRALVGFWSLMLGIFPLSAQPFLLPTSNHALFEKGGEEKFFVGTVGKPWTSGTFGCVRSEGWQVHEGLDIRCLQRDRRGEPVDPVMATADGTVAYVNTRPSLS